MKKIALALSILILFLAALVFAVAVALGYFPGISQSLGIGKPKDLDVTYTDDDYLRAREKLDAALESQTVAETFTDAELTALLNSCTETACVAQNVQVKTNADGTLEISGTLDRDKVEDLILQVDDVEAANESSISSFLKYLPPEPSFYIDAEIVGEDDVMVIDVREASLGGVQLTGNTLDDVGDELNHLVADYLSSLPGTQMTALTVSENGLYIEGDLHEVNEEDLH